MVTVFSWHFSIQSGNMGLKKDRCLFLFSDLLVITNLKRKSGTIRKPSTNRQVRSSHYAVLFRNGLTQMDCVVAVRSYIRLWRIINTNCLWRYSWKISSYVNVGCNSSSFQSITISDCLYGQQCNLRQRSHLSSVINWKVIWLYWAKSVSSPETYQHLINPWTKLWETWWLWLAGSFPTNRPTPMILICPNWIWLYPHSKWTSMQLLSKM